MDLSILGPKPDQPPVPIDWAAVERWLGLTLPADYKAIATAYGPLDIGEYVWLHVPMVQRDRFDYGEWLAETHRHCRIASREAPAFHPEPDGLLAWGTTRGADHLFWDTGAADDPDRWPVVLFHQDAANAGADPWIHYGKPLLATLAVFTEEGVPGRAMPLRPGAERTAFLPGGEPWSPPPPAPPEDPRRRAALTEGSGLAALTALVPPPETPYLGDGSWDDLFRHVGTRLPAEFVALLDRYGAGCWGDWLRFHPPLADGGRGLVHYATGYLDGYRELRDEFPEYQPLAVWPEPGGFLPFADSIDGDALGWLTQGTDPDAWPLIVAPRHADQGPPLPHDLTTTLLEWRRGRFATEGLPGLDAGDDPLAFATFIPWEKSIS